MNVSVNRRSLLALGAAPITLPSWSAAFPAQPIRMVVPFAPAGFIDVIARIFSEKLVQALSQPVVVENKPGASGNIGTQFVAKAAPDGHTLLVGFDGTLVINPSIYSQIGFNTMKDFAPVLKLADSGLVLVASRNVNFKNLRELIAHSKADPGRPLSYATSGVGSTPHISGELLSQQAGIKLNHIPYKGGGQAMNDVVSGQVPLCITAPTTALPHLRSGRLIALGVTGANRIDALPHVPTFSESGLNGFAVNSWVGILAPAKTPTEIIARLHREFFLALSKPDVREKFLHLGLDAVGNSPQEFAVQIRADLERYSKVVKAAHITVDS